MDLSKLPRLSQTDRASQTPADAGKLSDPPRPAEPSVVDYQARPPGVHTSLAEAWISFAVGAILLLMQQRFLAYLAGSNTGWIFYDARGNVIPYTQSPYFILDLGLASFGAAMILDGVLFLLRRSWAVQAALVVTLAATGLNLYSTARLFPSMEFMPAIAVAVGIYLVICQLSLLRAPRQASASQ